MVYLAKERIVAEPKHYVRDRRLQVRGTCILESKYTDVRVFRT